MESGTDRLHGSVSVVAAVARNDERAPVGVGTSVTRVARLLRAMEQAPVLDTTTDAYSVVAAETAVEVSAITEESHDD